MITFTRFSVYAYGPRARREPMPAIAPAVIRAVGPGDLAAIDAARPGYGARAARYLADGHEGFAVWAEGQVASLAWLRLNPGPRARRVGYYPLPPGRIWFHAAWTHPAFEGRGYHRALIRHRLDHARAAHGDAWIECNVGPGGERSARNYMGQGFVPAGSLLVLAVRGRTVAWRAA